MSRTRRGVLVGLALGTLVEGFGPLGQPKQALISALEPTPSASATPGLDEAALNGDASPLPSAAHPGEREDASQLPVRNECVHQVVRMGEESRVPAKGKLVQT